MSDMKNWLKHHHACIAGYSWALKSCSTMQNFWDTARPDWLIWAATRKGCLTDRELWEFALWSAEQVRHLMTDERSTNALDVRRRWLDGNATDEEMDAARAAAAAAARAAVAGDAEGAASLAAAGDATAWAAAGAAVGAASLAAAGDAALAAARAAVGDAQAAWLRENCKPSFEIVTKEAER